MEAGGEVGIPRASPPRRVNGSFLSPEQTLRLFGDSTLCASPCGEVVDGGCVGEVPLVEGEATGGR